MGQTMVIRSFIYRLHRVWQRAWEIIKNENISFCSFKWSQHLEGWYLLTYLSMRSLISSLATVSESCRSCFCWRLSLDAIKLISCPTYVVAGAVTNVCSVGEIVLDIIIEAPRMPTSVWPPLMPCVKLIRAPMFSVCVNGIELSVGNTAETEPFL